MFRAQQYTQLEGTPRRHINRHLLDACSRCTHDFLWEFGGGLEHADETDLRRCSTDARAINHSLDKALALAG